MLGVWGEIFLLGVWDLVWYGLVGDGGGGVGGGRGTLDLYYVPTIHCDGVFFLVGFFFMMNEIYGTDFLWGARRRRPPPPLPLFLVLFLFFTGGVVFLF